MRALLLDFPAAVGRAYVWLLIGLLALIAAVLPLVVVTYWLGI